VRGAAAVQWALLFFFGFLRAHHNASLRLQVENTERFLGLALYQGIPRISSQYALARDAAAGITAPAFMSQQVLMGYLRTGALQAVVCVLE
jgi:hypothetical protein